MVCIEMPHTHRLCVCPTLRLEGRLMKSEECPGDVRPILSGTCTRCVFITKREKAKSEAQRGKPKGTLERNSQCDIVVRTAPSALYWCGNVVIDRRGNQLGEVLVFMRLRSNAGAGQPGDDDVDEVYYP